MSWSRSTAWALVLVLASACSRPSPGPRRDPAPAAPGLPYEEQGRSSWYGGGDGFAGKPTASGEPFDPAQPTCAHRTLPLGTRIEVENLANGRKVLLRVNDRGPFARGRILDVSRRAAQDLGFLGQGTAEVRLRTVDAQGRPAALDPDLDARNPYTIQVAALSDPANIARLSRELETAFGPVSLQEVPLPGGRAVQRVRVGSYPRLSQAQRALEDLQVRFRDRGLDPFITRKR